MFNAILFVNNSQKYREGNIDVIQETTRQRPRDFESGEASAPELVCCGAKF